MPDFEMERVRRSSSIWQVMLKIDGERVAGLNLHIMKMRIGSVPVPMAGIGGVGTHEKHRKKGYASEVMWDAIELMDKQDWEFSVLFGIPRFYHRFGYGVAFPESELTIRAEDLAHAGRPLKTRVMKKADAPSVRRLYAKLSAERTGSTARPAGWTYFHRAAHYSKPGKTLLSMNGNGRVSGYATWNFDERRERFNLSEIAGSSPEDYESLAANVARQAVRAGHEQVRITLPPDDPFGAFCSRFGGRWDLQYPKNGGSMARIIQLDRLFKRLEPELQRRWSSSSVAYRGLLALETDIGSVGIRLTGRSAKVVDNISRDGARVRMPQLKLSQLLMGYRDIDDLSYDDDVSAPRTVRAAMDALFPKQNGYMWWSDRF